MADLASGCLTGSADGVAAGSALLDAVAAPGRLVEAHDFGPPTGRGLRCTRRVAAGETLLSVPLAHCATSESAAAAVAEEWPSLAALDAEALTPQDRLCLWLLLGRSKGGAGAWAA